MAWIAFFISMPTDHGKLSVTVFLVPWEPTFISFNEQKHVFKHTLKLKNIGVYYQLQKTAMSINMSEEGFLNVKFVCTKVSKTPDSSSIQLKKWTQLKCLLQIIFS